MNLFVKSILFPLIYLYAIPLFLIWRNWFKKIKYFRDNQNEKELLDIVKNDKTKNQKYFYALYALADLGNLEVKEIISINFPFQGFHKI